MKKIMTLVALSLFSFTGGKIMAKPANSCCVTKSGQISSCFFNSECTQEFLKGVLAGATANVTVEYVRNNILPDISNWNVYTNYGICGDKLTGAAIAGTASLGIAAFSKEHYSKFKKVGAQIIGVIVGMCAASYASKILATAVASSAPVAPAVS